MTKSSNHNKRKRILPDIEKLRAERARARPWEWKKKHFSLHNFRRREDEKGKKKKFQRHAWGETKRVRDIHDFRVEWAWESEAESLRPWERHEMS